MNQAPDTQPPAIVTTGSAAGEPVPLMPVTDAAAADPASELLAAIKQLGTDNALLDEHAIKHLRRRWSDLQDAPRPATGLADEIETRLKALRDQLHRQLERREQAFAAVQQALTGLIQALDKGALKQAGDCENRIHKLLPRIVGLSKPRRYSISQALDELQPRLRELKGWRHWGTTVAREELITRIENLIDSGEAPIAAAQQIQEARETWQSWDRSGDTPGKELWQRFDTACTRAYEPCKAYFAHQAEVRLANHAARQALSERLEQAFAVEDWSAPDWRHYDKLVQHALSDWRTLGNVNRKQRKALEQRFSNAIAQFGERLDRERSRDLKRRQGLIDQVRALAEVDDIEAAIESTKQAQAAWKPTVLGRRGEENRLWKAFKSACDEVFARRQQVFKARAAERDAERKEQRDVCTTLESLATADSATSDTLHAALRTAREAWNRADAARRRPDPLLEKRYRNATRQARQRLAMLHREQQQAALTSLANRATLCERLEYAALAGTAPDPEARQEIDREWQALAPLPSEDQAAIETRYRAADAAVDGDATALAALNAALPANAAYKQQLCLQLEVLAEVDSPAEFMRERMAYQIERLSRAMGKHAAAEPPLSDATEGARRFHLAGAVPPSARDALAARFSRITAAFDTSRS